MRAPGLVRFAGVGDVDLVVCEEDPTGELAADLEDTRAKLVVAAKEEARL